MCLQNNQMYSSPTLDLTCPEITISKQTRFWDCNRVIKRDYTWARVDIKFLFELNTRTKIPYQQATMYSCVNHINTTALCWQWKVNFINEWKQKDRQSPNEIVSVLTLRLNMKKCVGTLQNQTIGTIFNVQNSQLLTWSLPTEEVYQVHGQSRTVVNLPVVHYQSHRIRNFQFFFP